MRWEGDETSREKVTSGKKRDRIMNQGNRERAEDRKWQMDWGAEHSEGRDVISLPVCLRLDSRLALARGRRRQGPGSSAVISDQCSSFAKWKREEQSGYETWKTGSRIGFPVVAAGYAYILRKLPLLVSLAKDNSLFTQSTTARA